LLVEQLAAIAQSGLAYTDSVYDRDRYVKLRELTSQLHGLLVAEHPPASALVGDDLFEQLYPEEIGYRTPKVDVRGIVFRDGRVLLVNEKSDGRWSVPGGWADVGESPSESIVKEIREESGYDAKVVRLLALLDRSRHGHGPFPWHTYKAFFLCEVAGKPLGDSMETQGVGFFALDALPELSTGRITAAQLHRMYAMVQSDEYTPWID
jgi:ADP-ribose pyrophosphatase YjhB (NUDIX family)